MKEENQSANPGSHRNGYYFEAVGNVEEEVVSPANYRVWKAPWAHSAWSNQLE